MTVLEHTLGMVGELTTGLDPEGGLPPILVTDGPRGVNLMQMVMPGGEEDIEDTAYAITANIAVLRATEAVFVAGAWQANPQQDEAATVGTEVMVLLHGTADGQRMMVADVLRSDAAPPVIGDWATQNTDGAQGLGIFGDAISQGLALAADLGSPEQHEARRQVDEILDSEGIEAAMRVMIAIWRQSRQSAGDAGQA